MPQIWSEIKPATQKASYSVGNRQSDMLSSFCMKLIICKPYLILLLAVLCAVALPACKKETPITVQLEPSPPLSGGIGWAVVTIAWVRLKTEPGHASTDAAFVRRQDILELVGRVRRSGGRDAGIWFQVKLAEASGWIHESAVVRYQTREQAEYALRND